MLPCHASLSPYEDERGRVALQARYLLAIAPLLWLFFALSDYSVDNGSRCQGAPNMTAKGNGKRLLPAELSAPVLRCVRLMSEPENREFSD